MPITHPPTYPPPTLQSHPLAFLVELADGREAPVHASVTGRPNVGVVFIEDTASVGTAEALGRAAGFDVLVAGSTWTMEVLRRELAPLGRAGALWCGLCGTICSLFWW